MENRLLQGFNNENILSEDGKYIRRTHKKNVRNFDRYVFSEKRILRFLKENGFPAPELVSSSRTSLILRYIEGESVDRLYGSSGEMPEWIPRKIAKQMIGLHALDASEFAKKMDRDKFLSDKLQECENIRLALESDFPGLFALLSFPKGFSFNDLHPGCSITDFLWPIEPCLCHFDVNRKNIIVREKEDDCIIIDWETAGIGDPLCDVAIHLQKMRYVPENENQFLATLFEGFGPLARKDTLQVIDLYRRIETVKYAYTDVVRILEMLSNDSYPGKDVDNAIGRYHLKYRKALDVWKKPLLLSPGHLKTVIKEYMEDL